MKQWRINTIFCLILIFGAAIISRLFFLQVINHKFYQSQALGQQTLYQQAGIKRGEIFVDKTGLAINGDNWIVYINENKLEDKETVVKSLSEILKESVSKISNKIQGSYSKIKENLSEEEITKIRDLSLKGVYLDKTTGRYYPQNSFAAQLVGFLGGNEKGQYGIEGFYDETLKGKKISPDSTFLFDEAALGILDANGSDLHLTIDYNIQFEVEALLKKAKKDFNIDSGQIIVMDPSTGKIIAMADYPAFDLNQYSKEENIAVFQNSAVQKIFELGSILKPITMSMAIQEDKVTPSTTYTDEGCVKVGIANLCNFGDKKYGIQTMTQVLEKSLNTGAIFLSKLIPHSIYLDYFDKFGLAEKTGIDLQGEVSSNNDNLRKGQDVNFATASYGQGIDLTPIQLLRAFAAVINGGKLMRPYVVEKIVNNTGITEIKPKVSRQVISAETSTTLRTMLVSVIEQGFATKAKVEGYYLGGKTGTAQVPYENKAGYYPDKTIQSFIGFGPAQNSRFVVLIKLDDPKNTSSGTSAAPIFSELARYILNYWQIPPDYEQ